ncbi:MAG: hypothetical protein NTX65_14855 [Ignavibacteriales bacterium]|nr:hypothetical protein [Ignavibacteriales bacterium]
MIIASITKFILQFFFASPTSIFINIFIIIIASYAFIRVIQLYIKILNSKKEFTKLVCSVDEGIGKVPIVNFASYLTVMEEGSILYKRLYEFHKIRLSGKELSIDIVDSVVSTIPLPGAMSAKKVSGILVLLGLLGTIVGLSQSILPMRELLVQKDVEAITNSMISFLSGMSTAFSTTLLGIISTLLVLFILFFYEKHKNSLEESFERLIVGKIIPAYSFVKSRDDLDDIKHIMTDISTTLTGVVQQTVKTNENTRELYQNLFDSVASLTKVIREVVTPLGQSGNIQSEMLSILRNVEEVFNKFSESSIEMKTSISDFTSKYDQMIRSVDETIGQLKTQSFESQELKNQLSSYSEKTDSLITRTDSFTLEIRNTNVELQKIIPEIVKMTSITLKDIKDSVQNSINEINKTLSLMMNEGNDGFLSGIKKINDETINMIKYLRQTLDEHSEKQYEHIGELTKQLNTTLLSITEQFTSAQNAFSTENKNMLITNISQITNSISQLNSSVQTKIDNMAGELKQAVQSSIRKIPSVEIDSALNAKKKPTKTKNYKALFFPFNFFSKK